MINPETKLFCRLDRVKPIAKDKRRVNAIATLASLDTQVTNIFEQATQTAARFLEIPVSFAGLMGEKSLAIESLTSFSTLPLINQFRSIREIPRGEAFCSYVVDSERLLAIADVAQSEVFSQSFLFQFYNISAYLGVPLLTSAGECLGTLSVADFQPHSWTDKDIEFLTLLSDWVMSEIQRRQLETKTQRVSVDSSLSEFDQLPKHPSTQNIKIELLNHLCQDLLTPLTSIKGMTSVLRREMYGALNYKQKEYLDIINCSGKYMLSLVEEILSLDILDESSKKLYLSSVDLEMVCQQAIASVEYMAAHRQQKLQLAVPPESRIWLVDKDKVRQMLYYLMFTLLQIAEPGCLFEIVVGQQHHKLAIAIGVTSKPSQEPASEMQHERSFISIGNQHTSNSIAAINKLENSPITDLNLATKLANLLAAINFDGVNSTSLSSFLTEVESINRTSDRGNHSRESLGLLLSYKLAELHGGQISAHQLADYGCCYLITLPQLVKASA